MTEVYQCHALHDKGEILCSRFENKFDATLKLTTIKEGKIKLIMLNSKNQADKRAPLIEIEMCDVLFQLIRAGGLSKEIRNIATSSKHLPVNYSFEAFWKARLALCCRNIALD